MKYIQKVNVDLSKNLNHRVQVKQNDNARYIEFTIYDGGTPFNLTGKTVRAFGEKSDNKIIYNDMTITDASKGKCELRLTSQTVAASGLLRLEVEIRESKDIISTFVLNVNVNKGVRRD